MCDKIKFKMINVYGTSHIKNKKKKYFEVLCEPSYDGDVLLLCTKSKLSFDEVIYILEKKNKKVDLIGAISFVYYDYSSLFFDYIKKSGEEEFKILKKKCFHYFERLFNFIKYSDDSLYDQNEYIRNIYFLMKNK